MRDEAGESRERRGDGRRWNREGEQEREEEEGRGREGGGDERLSLIHISEPTRQS